jgi:hypothetical protein
MTEQDEQKLAGKHSDPTRAADPQAPEPISTFRKVRLGALVCILVLLCAAALAVRARMRRQEERQRQEVAGMVAEMRVLAAGIGPSVPLQKISDAFRQCLDLWGRIEALDPGNTQAHRLMVALTYAAGSTYTPRSIEWAASLFNQLDPRAIAPELDGDLYRRAFAALSPFPDLQVDAVGVEIQPAGIQYLRSCGLLWAIARSITEGAQSDTARAERLCRWFALHMCPERLSDLPADPYMAVWRGYGSPAELAWTYAELARQVGLRCEVVVPQEGDESAGGRLLIQVSPSDGPPLLVDPEYAVPLLDADSGQPLSVERIYGRPASAGGPDGGQEAPPAGDGVSGPRLLAALDPSACYPRSLVFEHLLSVMPEHPRVAVARWGMDPDRPFALWTTPIDVLSEMGSESYRRASPGAYAALWALRSGRDASLTGNYVSADSLYSRIAADARPKLAAAEVREAAALLTEELNLASFFAAANTFDAGDFAGAEKALRGYLDGQPAGRWRVPAALMLAETLAARGDGDGAAGIWRDLPPSRAAYGALRLKGLLAPAPLPQVPAAAAPAGPE